MSDEVLLRTGTCAETGVRTHAAWWGVDRGPNIPVSNERIESLIDAYGGVSVYSQKIQMNVKFGVRGFMAVIWRFSLPAHIMTNATFGGDPALGTPKVLALDMEYHEGASIIRQAFGAGGDWGHHYNLRGAENHVFSVSYRHQY